MNENEKQFFTNLENEIFSTRSIISADPNDAIKYAQDEQLQIAGLADAAEQDIAGRTAVDAVAAIYGSRLSDIETSLVARHASIYQGPNAPIIMLEGGLYVDGRMDEFIYARLFGQRTIALVVVNAMIEMDRLEDIELAEKKAPVFVPVLSIDTYSYL